jgi:TonB-linked SusC/RagA family outer membrane protein
MMRMAGIAYCCSGMEVEMIPLMRRAHTVALALIAVPVVAAAQDARVTGRVTSDAALPIAGASIGIPELGVGSMTNSDGHYSFVVPAARVQGQTVTLAARHIGFMPQTRRIVLRPGDITEDFTLRPGVTQLSQVVVTGEGTSTTREHLTTTVNSVDTAVLQRANNPQNVVSALAATAPNVEVRTQSGEPGSSASIKIRGNASLTGTNQPLFVVDGQPIDNTTISTNGGDQSTVAQNRVADINPVDIESIDILKGAAASAIYGARAANGVVLITTKRGRPGETHFTLTSLEAFDHIQRRDILQTSFAQGTNGLPVVCAAPDCALTRLSWGPLLTTGAFDHLGEIYKTGLTSDNNIAISGGNERTSFYASGGLSVQDGVIVGGNNKYNRATARLKASHDLTSKLTLAGNFNYVDTRGAYVQKGSNVSGLLLGALRTPPSYDNVPFLTPSGLQRPYRFPNPSTAESFLTAAYYDNPFFVINNPANRSELGRSIANVTASYQLYDWLKLSNTLGADYYNDSRLEALPLTSAADANGNVTRLDLNNLEIDNNLIATARRSFRNDDILTTLTVGQNLNSRRYRQWRDFGEQLIAPAPFSLNNTVTITSNEFRALRHIEAYFLQLEGNLFNQVDVNVGVRDDGFSTFGSSKQYHLFPKASFGWIFTNTLRNEERTGWLSFGKLRFAYGETGKEPPVYGAITALSSQALFGPGGYGDAITTKVGGQGGIVTGDTLGNAGLRPERSREVEGGFDFGFLDQRADFSATWYNKRTDDVILAALPVNAAQTGARVAVTNGASLKNTGVELSFTARPYTTSRLAWDVGAQYGRNRGTVTNLLGAEFIPYNNEGFTGAIGSSTLRFAPGVIRGKDFARCGITAPINGFDVTAACGPNAPVGALFLAANGQPILDPVDRVIGDPNPRYTMSFNTAVHIGGRITLSGLVDVRKGGDVWNGTRGILNYFGTAIETLDRTSTEGIFGVNVLADKYPVVAGPGAAPGVVAFRTMGEWQTWYNNNGGGFGPIGAQFVEDGSFTKLRELSITYNIDGRLPQALGGFSSIDVRLAGRNLHTWTKYRGLDPEANLGGAEFLTQGLDYFNNPQIRSFVIALSFNH